MYQLLETIKVKNGTLQNLPFHNERVNYSRMTLLKTKETWDLSQLIHIPDLDAAKVYRCRFLYSRNVEKVEFLPYTPRLIDRLYLVQADKLEYSFKYADREALDDLKKKWIGEPNADILMVRNGLITDTSFSNIAFHDGTGWITPDPPLLKGTKRAYYIEQGLIQERRIRADDLHQFQRARLINAMLDLDMGESIGIHNILQ